MFRIPKRRGLGVDGAALLADVGMLQNVEALSVRRHQAVFDAVVHHLDEMPGAARSTMQIAFLRGAAGLFASSRARYLPASGREAFEDRIESFDDVARAADHQAVASFEPPYAAARSDIDVMDALGC